MYRGKLVGGAWLTVSFLKPVRMPSETETRKGGESASRKTTTERDATYSSRPCPPSVRDPSGSGQR